MKKQRFSIMKILLNRDFTCHPVAFWIFLLEFSSFIYIFFRGQISSNVITSFLFMPTLMLQCHLSLFFGPFVFISYCLAISRQILYRLLSFLHQRILIFTFTQLRCRENSHLGGIKNQEEFINNDMAKYPKLFRNMIFTFNLSGVSN